MKRFGQIIKVKKEKLFEYKQLHAAPWQEVLDLIKASNIQNYSIFVYNEDLLFAYFEYVGINIENDFEKLSSHPTILQWWQHTNPCQESLSSTGKGWLDLEQVFLLE